MHTVLVRVNRHQARNAQAISEESDDPTLRWRIYPGNAGIAATSDRLYGLAATFRR